MVDKKKIQNVYISVGSNIAPRENIIKALILIKKELEVIKSSTFYITRPLCGKDQDNYINGVWLIRTDKDPGEIKYSVLENIEKELKRKRLKDKFAPRTIDLDILLYGSLTIKDVNLTIPDPDIFDRIFLAKCILELDKDIVPPGRRFPLKDIIKNIKALEMAPDKAFTQELKDVIKNDRIL